MSLPAMDSPEPINDLYYYTLGHPDRALFIHQYCVDAYTAQIAGADTKPIALAFALAGLYLALEKGFTGLQVQQAHQRLSHHKEDLPLIPLPGTRGPMGPEEVLLAPPGAERDRAIRDWCAAVWGAYAHAHNTIADYCHRHLT